MQFDIFVYEGHDLWHTRYESHFWTVSFTDLDQSSEVIIFGPLLKLASFVEAVPGGAVSKIDSSLKLNHHKQILLD